jgi:regulator of protease activity HflC (stomatin/prohibitin superfamily)
MADQAHNILTKVAGPWGGRGGVAPRRFFKWVALGVAVFLILSAFSGSFYRVQEYERAVLTTFGKFSGVTGPGLHFKLPFVQVVTFFPVNIQELSVEHVNTYTIDNQELDAKMTVFYRLPVESIESIYRNVPDFRERVIALSIDRFKSEMGKINVTQVAQRRGEVRDRIKVVLAADVRNTLGIDIVDFQVPSIDYTSSFRAAVDAGAVAKTLVEKAEQEKRQAEVVADQRRIAAAGEAAAARERAAGEADAKLLIARAEAESIRLKGEAEATVLAAQSRALGDNSRLVELRKVERWDGSVPQWNGTGPLPLLQLSAPPQP